MDSIEKGTQGYKKPQNSLPIASEVSDKMNELQELLRLQKEHVNSQFVEGKSHENITTKISQSIAELRSQNILTSSEFYALYKDIQRFVISFFERIAPFQEAIHDALQETHKSNSSNGIKYFFSSPLKNASKNLTNAIYNKSHRALDIFGGGISMVGLYVNLSTWLDRNKQRAEEYKNDPSKKIRIQKDKPTNVINYEVNRIDRVKNFPDSISLPEVTINVVDFPAFQRSLVNDRKGQLLLNIDYESKKPYESAVKTEIAKRANAWIEQYVSYIPNYKGCCEIGIVIHHPNFNDGHGIVVYPINKPGYIKQIQDDNKITDKQAELSVDTQKDYISNKPCIGFYERTLLDRNCNMLNVVDVDKLVDTLWVYNEIYPNLLKLVIADIKAQDQNMDTQFQGFLNFPELTQTIAGDCGLSTDPHNIFSLIMTQYIIDGSGSYWGKPSTDNNNQSPSYCLHSDCHGYDPNYTDGFPNILLCMDYMASK